MINMFETCPGRGFWSTKQLFSPMRNLLRPGPNCDSGFLEIKVTPSVLIARLLVRVPAARCGSAHSPTAIRTIPALADNVFLRALI